MNFLESKYPNSTETEWKKVRSYLYKQEQLMVSQVESVVTYLDAVQLPTSFVLQQSPRVLRSNVSTKLRPTYELLQSLFGNRTTLAIQKNPDLLLTSEIGYQTQDNLDLMELCLKSDLMLSDSAVEKLQKRHPTLFQQSVSGFLALLQLLRIDCALPNDQISNLLLKQPTLFQLSPEALKSRIDALESLSHRIMFEPANAGILCQSAESIRQKVGIVGSIASSKHPPILGLSVENIQSKLDFFERLHPSLASAILNKSPSVMSLKLESIQAKVKFLRENLWRNSTEETGIQLSNAPTCLSISLERNLRPTVAFFQATHYWNSSIIITGRHLSASLYGRLLPRYLFHPQATISQLVFDSDSKFCGGKYLDFRKSDMATHSRVDETGWISWLEKGVLHTGGSRP